MSAASVQEAPGESRNDADSRFEPNKTGRNEVGPPEPPQWSLLSMAQSGGPPARRADRINSAESPRLAVQSRGTRCARRALDLRAGCTEGPHAGAAAW